MTLTTQSSYSSRQRSRRNRRIILQRAGIACSFAAMTCWPMAVIANTPPEPPEWPATQEEIDAYIDALVDQSDAIPAAADFYASQDDPTVLVQEFVQPDLNGDGIGDLVIPQPNLGPTDVRMGRVGVISGWFGDRGLFIDVTSDEAGDSFGSIVVGIADIDGDQIEDLAVGAPTSSLGAALGGRVDVISGATGDVILQIVGNEADGRLGSAVASAGDCNGDGINDLIVGEPHTNAVRGRAFVYYGAAGLGDDGAVTRSPADADLSLTDGLAGAQFGLGVAGVGDLDGDTFPELAIGSPNRGLIDPDDPTNGMIERLGAVRVYSGVDGAHLFTINGETENGWLGRAMLGMPDQDGDGRNELLFSAPGFPVLDADPAPAGPPATDGRVFALTSGAIGLLAAGAELTVSDASFELARPAGATFQFGERLELGHDTDGDGAPEVLVYASQPVQAVIEDLGGIDLAALGVPLNLPVFTLENRTHLYSGADHSLLYSFNTGEGSGVEIQIPYPGPAAEEQNGQFTPIGDVDLDMDVDAVDLGITIANVGQPTASSPTTDINQSGVTEVEDVEIITDIIAMEAGIEDCLERVENGEFETVCLCLEGEYGIDPGALTGEEMDCGDGDGEPEPGPGGEGPGGENGCDQEEPEEPEDCALYAEEKASCEFGPDKAALDAEQDAIDAAADAANDALATARANATAAKDAARAQSLAVANAAMSWVAAPAARRAMGNSLAWGAVGTGAVGSGGIMILSATASTGVGAILVVIGGGVMIWRIHTTVADVSALIDNTREAFQGNAFGDPSSGYSTRPTFANGGQLPLPLWTALQNAGANWVAARAAYHAAHQAAGEAWAQAMQEIDQQQMDLDQRRQECEEDMEARKEELEAACTEATTE